jgi:hypothetical protein
MFGLDFLTIFFIDIISQVLNIPNKLMHLLDKVIYGVNELWLTLKVIIPAILAELKTTQELTFNFTISRTRFTNPAEVQTIK